MKSHSFLRRAAARALATGVLITLSVVAASAQPPPGQKPKILFVLMDNLGYGEVGVYGGGVLRDALTPRIDRLAIEGTRLTNFNVEAQCTPSRSALMTGRFAIRSATHSVPFRGRRAPVPYLRSDEEIFRQGLGAPGRRKNRGTVS